MSYTVSATEAKNRLGALLADVSERHDEVIIESHGRAKAVIVPIDVYDEMSEIRDRRQRQEALAKLFELADTISARNRDLTEEQAIALADEIAHGAVDRLAEKGLVTFERDRHGG
jgi:prevent-host-death family protein